MKMNNSFISIYEQISIFKVLRVFSTYFGLLICATTFGQTLTLTLKPNPVVTQFEVPQGGTLSVSSVIETTNTSVGTYEVRIILKRSDNTLFTLHSMQNSLQTGNNFIVGVEFSIDANNFNSIDKSGNIYAEIQQSPTTNNPIYTSPSIPVVIVGPVTPPSGGASILNNIICCGQCILAGDTPVLIGQASGQILSGPITESKTVWEFLPDGHSSGYILNGNSQNCQPYSTNTTVRYRRLLNSQHVAAESTDWVATLFNPLGTIIDGKNDPESYTSSDESNWITITVSSLTPAKTFPAKNYTQIASEKAGTITILGNQALTNLALGTVNFIASKQVIIKPDSKISPNIRLSVDPSIIGCNASGRSATVSEIQSEIKQPAITSFESKDSENMIAYPNPTNAETTIIYRVTKKGIVKLYVSDAKGRHIATLIDDKDIETGEYKAVFDSKELVSGIYYYTLVTKGYSRVKRLSVINK